MPWEIIRITMNNQSLSELLRNYADIITEANGEGNRSDNDFQSDDDNPAFNVPDEEAPLEDDYGDADEPVTELSHAISVRIGGDEQKIEQAILGFLQKNKYELIPLGGISNNDGQV